MSSIIFNILHLFYNNFYFLEDKIQKIAYFILANFLYSYGERIAFFVDNTRSKKLGIFQKLSIIPYIF